MILILRSFRSEDEDDLRVRVFLSEHARLPNLMRMLSTESRPRPLTSSSDLKLPNVKTNNILS